MADRPCKDQTAPRHRKVVRGHWCFAPFPVRVSAANGSFFDTEDGRRNFFCDVDSNNRCFVWFML